MAITIIALLFGAVVAASADRIEAGALPASWDWRTKGCVTPVRNQGQCGDSGVVAAVEAIEGCHCRTVGQLVELSTQQVVECAPSATCDGGVAPNQVFEYVKKNGGLDSDECYPESPIQNKCRYNPVCCSSALSNYTVITRGNETALQYAVFEGPVAAEVDASQWETYTTGVWSSSTCSASQLDHVVLVVGWGTEAGQDYWIVKNSWGSAWGTNGYMLLARNKHNMCGIATAASLPHGCGNCKN